MCARQYRFPPVHKEEILKQTNELLENEIIKPSQFPYNTPVWIVPKKLDSQGNKKWQMVLDFRKLITFSKFKITAGQMRIFTTRNNISRTHYK